MSGGGVEARVGRRAEQKRRWDRENYVPSTMMRERRDARRRRILELWAQGADAGAIAADIGTTQGTVENEIYRMRREGIDVPRRYRGWGS